MSHSWLNRLVPMLLLVPGVVMTSAVVVPATAHAVAACDEVEVSASVKPGIGETVVFKLKNCTSLAQHVVLSGKRKAPANCTHSGLNFGDSPPVALAAGQSKKFFHLAPGPTCKGVYTVTGDSELKGTETVLDADLMTYTV